MKEYYKNLSKIKSILLLRCRPVYAGIGVSCHMSFVSDPSVTAHTDGVKIVFGTKFWDTLSTKGKVFLVLHEVCHILLSHIDRFMDLSSNTKNQSLWGKAADYFINPMLVNDNDRGVYDFIEGGLLDEDFNGLCTNEIYKILKDKSEKGGGGGSGNNPLEGDLKPSSISKSSSTERKEMENIISNVLRNTKSTGWTNDPVFNSLLGDLIAVPKVNWKVALIRYMNIKFKQSKDYMRPNRRVAYDRSLIIKSPKTNVKLGDLFVYIDVSGSCTEKDIKNMVTELHYITLKYKPESIVFSTFNTGIVETFHIKGIKDIPTDIKICGGTDINACIQHVNNHRGKVCLTIIMSDMWADDFDKPKNSDLLLLVIDNPNYQNKQAKIIHYEG